MKILITGHNGFIGTNLIKKLSDHELSFYEWGGQYPNLTGMDWCIHLGAISSTTEYNVEKLLTQNLDFSIKLLNDCIKNNVNFQYASSASVYGFTKDFREDSAKKPMNPYAWTKFLFDRYVENLGKQDIIIQGFRYFNVYGPGEQHKGDQASPYSKFEKQAKETGVITIFEKSDRYLRDFIHVDKIVDIHKTFLNVQESGIWNAGTGKPKSFEQVAMEVARKYNAQIKYIPMPDNLKTHYQSYTCADIDKLSKHYII